MKICHECLGSGAILKSPKEFEVCFSCLGIGVIGVQKDSRGQLYR